MVLCWGGVYGKSVSPSVYFFTCFGVIFKIYIPVFSFVQCVGVIQLVFGSHPEGIPPRILCVRG